MSNKSNAVTDAFDALAYAEQDHNTQMALPLFISNKRQRDEWYPYNDKQKQTLVMHRLSYKCYDRTTGEADAPFGAFPGDAAFSASDNLIFP